MTKMQAEVVAFAINLLILAIPSVMLVVGWNRLVRDWRNGVVQSIAAIACLAFASASTLLALGSLFWQVFVGPIPRGDYRTEVSGLSLSFVGVISGFLTRDKNRQWYLGVGLFAAGWMLVWFVLTVFSY